MYNRHKDQVHFIGIGGIGMSGIAEVLLRQGFPVSGSDIQASETTRRLQDLGAKIYLGHKPDNLATSQVVVISSAILAENPELLEARRKGLIIVPRAEMLAELMRLKFGIAVAGTHGKTSTTSMLGTTLAACGEDPTVVVGGKVDALGGNAKLGNGKLLVAEADESDGSFLRLSPVITIVTNIDNDHLDFYGSMEKLRASFLDYINKVPYYGCAIVCIDDPEIRKILPLANKPIRTYGFSTEAHYQIQNFEPSPDGLGSRFDLYRKSGEKTASLVLRVPGKHNALNATATFIAALELDLHPDKVAQALLQYTGVRRRFEIKKQVNGATIVDDYGHHPTEISATIDAAKLFAKGRLLVAFQPHRYTRTQFCWTQFPIALAKADKVFLLDIYAAGENAIAGVDSQSLSKTIPGAIYTGSLENTAKVLAPELRKGDVLVTLGAGSITKLGTML